MGSSKQKTVTDTNQTQTSAPPSWTMPGLQGVAQQVTNAAANLPTTHYSGPMVASMDPSQLQAIMAAWGGTAANAGVLSGQLQGLMPNLTGIATGASMPNTSYSLAPQQELDNVIRASIQPVTQNLRENILPSITNSALAAGAYSGDRAMGVMPQKAVRDAQDSMQRIAAQLGYEDYNNYENRRLQAFQATTGAAQTNLGLQLQALGMAPEFVNSILHTQASQGDLLRMAAELQQQQQQLGINNAVGMDQYAAQSPFLGLDTASELLARLSGGWGTTSMVGHSDQTQTSSPALLPQLLQGALGVGSMIAGMPGIGGAIGGGGSALGGGAGAASLFTPMSAMQSLAPATAAPIAMTDWNALLNRLPH